MNYEQFITDKATELKSDGCTMVTEMFHWCCLEHDLGYRTGKDPRDAYKVGWKDAKPISRSETDARFRKCIQSKSKLGKASPIAAVRWLGVRVGGYFLWKH